MIIGTDPFETAFDLAGAVVAAQSHDADARLVACPRVAYDADLLIRGQYHKFYRMSARIGIPSPTYQMSAALVLDAADPRLTESFINSFFWAYANQWDQIDAAIKGVVHRLKLDYAAPADLDDHWGRVLGLRRRGGESDADYRTRLAIYIRKITSCGTAPNILAIVDRIIGVDGGSTIETFHPATVRVGWVDTETAKIAYPKSAQIDAAMDEALAAGVTWSTAYPYAEYQMAWGRWLPVDVTYSASAAVARMRGYVYLAATGLWDSGSETYDADALIYTARTTTYRSTGRVVEDVDASYEMEARLVAMAAAGRSATYDGGVYVSKSIRRYYRMSAVIE